jgi:hypothetical protein
MGKDTTKHLVSLPVFKQVMKIFPKEQFYLLVKQCSSDRYYKSFFPWDQLVVMLFGIFSRCDSIAEVCNGMRLFGTKAMKLNIYNIKIKPANIEFLSVDSDFGELSHF